MSGDGRTDSDIELAALQETLRQAIEGVGPARLRADRADRNLERKRWSVEQSVRSYNRRRVELLIGAMTAAGMGWCIASSHIVPADQLRGKLSYGTRWAGSEYYEHIEDYHSVSTICQECAKDVRATYHNSGTSSHVSLIPLDCQKVWSERFRELVPYKAAPLFEQFGITLPELRPESGLAKRYTIVGLEDEPIHY